MTESADLIRRLDSAISTKSLHPEYARGLLREAKEALVSRIVPCAAPLTIDFGWDNDESVNSGTCDVCHGESGGNYAGVACSSLGAVSFAYCDRCLSNQAEPAGMLQGIIADAGGLENLSGWVSDLNTWYNGAYVSVVDLPMNAENTCEPT